MMSGKLHFTMLIFCACFVLGSCAKKNDKALQPEKPNLVKGMIWIPGGSYLRGAVSGDPLAREDEKPMHHVSVNGFWMDETEVTNAQFRKFVDETGYLTVAERPVNWEELRKQLPANTPKPADSVLQPGSLSFECNFREIYNLNDYSQWWQWKVGANWKHPQGKGTSIANKDDHPVVQISYDDALAYCKWAGRRLPTEAEWEYAARGGLINNTYTWGADASLLYTHANTWQGEFPVTNTLEDKFERSAPVKSYPPNGFGLYDMAGNVWEWTNDWYDYEYYQELASNTTNENPIGPRKPKNPRNRYAQEKVIRGGSFLCHDSYCASYRVSARMATSYDTALEHLGFRTVLRPN